MRQRARGMNWIMQESKLDNNGMFHMLQIEKSVSKETYPSKEQFMWGPKFQVPLLTHVITSQYGGKVPTFEPQQTIKIWVKII